MKLLHLNLYSKGPFLYSNYPRKTYMQSLLETCTSFHCFMKNLLIYKVCLSNASVIYEAFIIIFADWGHVGNIICATGMMLRKQKWIHPPGCVTAVSFCTILAALQIWKSSGWFVLVNVISAQNERGVFYILLYVFFYLRANFGALFSAVVTGTGNFICLLVCWHSYPNVCYLCLFFQVTESHTECPAWPGDAVLGLSLVQGEICGVPVSQLSYTAPTWTSETQHKVILCGWRKHSTVLISVVNSSLWPGADWFLQGQHLINLCLERRCHLCHFQWAREEKLKIPLRQLNISH